MNFLKKHKRTLVLAMVDAVLCALSCTVAYFLLSFFAESSNVQIVLKAKGAITNSVILLLSILVCMQLLGVYKNIWRYATVKNFLSVIPGVISGTFLYYMTRIILSIDYPDIFIFSASILSIMSIIVSRMGYRYLYVYLRGKSDCIKKRTMIVGGGDACNRIIHEMRGTQSQYLPVVIVDDIEKSGRKINGVLIAGTTLDIPALAEEMNIEVILCAIPSYSAENKKRILSICSETTCDVKTLPSIHELIKNANMLGQAKSINIEDLLGRDVVKFDGFEAKQLISGKVCMVTGGGGSIGSELCRQIAKCEPKKLIIVDIYENNAYSIEQELLREHPSINLDVRIASVRDFDKMKVLFEMFKPDLLYHAAAHKHVPLMETSPEEAVKNNVVGTYNMAKLANMYKVKKFVLVSTDKAVNPTNVMGATKRCCEMIVQYFSQISTFTEFVAVRFGNVLGSNGSVIPLFEKQIASGGPITVTHPDIIRYFMTIPEAVSLILQAGTLAVGGEIFVLDMGEPVKILSLAEKLIKLHGKEPYTDIKIEFTGLRPGEKLFEELLMSEEGLRETANKKIFVGKQIEIDEKTFPQSIESIKNIAETNSSYAVIEELRKLVPTFNHVVINK